VVELFRLFALRKSAARRRGARQRGAIFTASPSSHSHCAAAPRTGSQERGLPADWNQAMHATS